MRHAVGPQASQAAGHPTRYWLMPWLTQAVTTARLSSPLWQAVSEYLQAVLCRGLPGDFRQMCDQASGGAASTAGAGGMMA